MINLQIRQAKQQIIEFISSLPYEIEVKRLLVNDIYQEFKTEADKVVLREMAEAQKALKESEDGGQE